MLVSLNHISKSFGTHQILSDISCTIERGDRIALIGPNGVGKSTFLQIIARELAPDGGEVRYVKNVRVSFVPQERDVSREGSERYSVGESRRTMLETALAQEAEVYLLDEPTNNLDADALAWLERKIKSSNAAFVFVSHDRAFLDSVANKIWTLDEQERTLESMNATYSAYLAEMERRREYHIKTYDEQQEEVERLTELVRRKKDDAARGDTFEPNDKDKLTKGFFRDRARGSAMQVKATNSRLAAIEQLERPTQREPMTILLDPKADGGTLGIELVDVVYRYKNADGTAGSAGVGPCTLRVPYGQRIGIIGKNGSGKSTLLKLLTGLLVPDSGEVTRGSHCRVGNLLQEYESLPQDDTVLELLASESGLKDALAVNLLKKFGISYRLCAQPIHHLSPGLRARLLLALYAARSVNVLVLDEPTNNLDLDALHALEELLQSYTGTVVLVSHDRALIKNTHLDELYRMEKRELRQPR